jgi:hypothetical protein
VTFFEPAVVSGSRLIFKRDGGEGVKNPQRFAVLAALCAAVALAGWAAVGLAGLGSPGIDSTGARIEVGREESAIARAEHVDAPQATPLDKGDVSVTDTGSGSALSDPRPIPLPATPSVRIASLGAPDAVRSEAKEATGSVKIADIGSSTTLPAPPMLRPATPTMQLAAVNPADPVQNAARPAVSSEALDACPEPHVCVDQYLWSLYERTPKVDTVKVEERIKTKVKIKGKTRTVVKTLTKYVTQDFAWKDPIAAQKAGMSLKDYVIGGMNRAFKRKLHDALRAMEEAGFAPGITSGFRDNYRQDLANGNKAASDSSYHGGSRRGGYGHGLAADLVSVKGETRAERCASSEILWKWIDAHEKELGIGRPYLDKDPPHVAPIDGKEYADKRGAAKARLAGLKKPSLSSNRK